MRRARENPLSKNAKLAIGAGVGIAAVAGLAYYFSNNASSTTATTTPTKPAPPAAPTNSTGSDISTTELGTSSGSSTLGPAAGGGTGST